MCNRGILLVKADGDLSRARLKGAVSPDEFMQFDPNPKFVEADPVDGFSILQKATKLPGPLLQPSHNRDS